MTIMKLTARTPKRVTAFIGTTLVLDAVRRRKTLVALDNAKQGEHR
jgi:hypothetical protein